MSEEKSKSSTFFQNLSVPFQKVVNSIAVDSTGKFLVLGGFVLVFASSLHLSNQCP